MDVAVVSLSETILLASSEGRELVSGQKMYESTNVKFFG